MSIILPVLWFVALASQGGCDQVLLGAKAKPKPGELSSKGVYLSYGLGALDCPGKPRASEVSSPNGRYKIQISSAAHSDDLTGSVHDNARTALESNKTIKFSTLSEILWSDDSSAFAITSSDGGWVGSCNVQTFAVKNHRVEKINLSGKATNDATKHCHCDGPDPPEVGALTWLRGSTQILLVAQVPPHSVCSNMGELFGYIVSVPSGEIVERFSEAQLRRKWERYFGERLKKP